MNPQNNIIEPTNRNHRILFTVITILLTAGIVGGSLWYVMDKQSKDQQKQIEELQKEKSENETKKKSEDAKQIKIDESAKIKAEEDRKKEAEALQAKSRSWADLEISKTEKVRVYLVSDNEKVSKVESIYCGAPIKGATQYSGSYVLALGNSSKINIGDKEFVENTPANGKIEAKVFDSTGLKKFIVLTEYGNCNHRNYRLYIYDSSNKDLKQVKFKGKSGSIVDYIISMSELSKNSGDNLVSKVYGNTSEDFGYTTTEWKFDPSNNTFNYVTSTKSDNF